MTWGYSPLKQYFLATPLNVLLVATLEYKSSSCSTSLFSTCCGAKLPMYLIFAVGLIGWGLTVLSTQFTSYQKYTVNITI